MVLLFSYEYHIISYVVEFARISPLLQPDL